MTPLPTIGRWLPLREAMAYSKLGRDLLRDLADTGQVRVGWTGGQPGRGHRRWDRESIDQYLTQGEGRVLEVVRSLKL